MNEHVLPAIIPNDKAEALLSVEEFDDAFAFAHDLGRHGAPWRAAAESTAAAAIAATAAVTVATAAAAAESTTPAAAETAALLVSVFTVLLLLAAEIVALVAAAPAAVAFAPFIETHEPSELISPPTPQTGALGPNGTAGHGA
jgi:hypothetical protein